FSCAALGGVAVYPAMRADDIVNAVRTVDKIADAKNVVKTGAYSSEIAADMANGLGKLEGKSIKVSDKGLNIVKSHLSKFGDFPENELMIGRFENALMNGEDIVGADASFYMHEVSEYTSMSKGIVYETAHAAALKKYDVSQFSVYHPEVIKQLPESFNINWRAFLEDIRMILLDNLGGFQKRAILV
ncbi:MAG: hypothetical protein AB9888_00055, partial [Bacteroidales bacterium]